MSDYTELYKRYRPVTWDDVVGQDKVVRSLISAVKSEKVPSAYLFAGERGTGKTSVAKILAKAINCENPPKPGYPCNECATCLDIDNGTQLGFSYISMANHGSVESVRSIVEDAQLSQPVRRPVIILDEIHNLSRAAFDALLIPLESDMPTLFIMCSTEVHKVPSTVLSRSQQRSFRKLNAEEISSVLTRIAEGEGFELTDDMRHYCITRAKGSARDAVSALEAALSSGVENVGYGDTLLRALREHDARQVMVSLACADADSVPFEELTDQLIEDVRSIYYHYVGLEEAAAGVCPIEDVSAFVDDLYGEPGVLHLLQQLLAARGNMAPYTSIRAELELVLLRYISTLVKKDKAAKF